MVFKLNKPDIAALSLHAGFTSRIPHIPTMMAALLQAHAVQHYITALHPM
jgi:hypothetical protein